MSVIRIVLLAEGAGELSGPEPGDRAARRWPVLRPGPGEALADEALGPGHVLVSRALLHGRRIPAAAIQFQAPLRTRGREARGSDLLDRRTLRQLLTWFRFDDQPQLCVVLVDRDGDGTRMAVLREHVSGLPTSSIVIAVAREEFESWLIADETSAGQVLGRPLSRAPDPESLGAREAKRTLADWMESIAPGARKEVRCLIARTCDLDVVARRCAAFQAFLDALRDVALS